MHKLLIVAFSGIVLTLPPVTHAQSRAPAGPNGYPTKPVRVLVSSAPAGGLDVISRIVADRLGQLLNKPMVVVNQAGGNGAIAGTTLAEATPDGYTLLSTSNSMILNGVLGRLKFDIRKEFVPVARQSSSYYLAIVPASSRVTSVKELLALAAAKPGALNYGSAGIGSVSHLGVELLQSMAKVKMVHVPYKGNAPASADLLAGRLDFMLATASALPLIRAGKARVIGTTGPGRHAAFPDIPTFMESGVAGFELSNTYTLYGPAKMPGVLINYINGQVAEILKTSDIKERFAADGSEPARPVPPAQLQAEFRKEFERWDKVVKEAGIKADAL